MRIVFLIIFLGINFANSQSIRIPEITPEHKENANTIKISDYQIVEYKSFDKVNVINKYSVLVLNEVGFNSIDLSENYNKSNKIKKLNVTIYTTFGGKIKTFNKSDFRDRSLFDDSTIFSDSRILFLDYSPTTYPFILEYECETESVNTAFLKAWMPISNLNETVLESKLEIIKNPNCNVNVKVQKLDEFNVEKTESSDKTIYTVKNIMAIKAETYADYSNEFPLVKMYLSKASLEGYELNMNSWSEFGKMYYDYFIKENSIISEKTKLKLDNIISVNDSKLDKIKKIYKYVQDNTRYVSVQVGIGGWKPMEVSDVEKYGYGDCKALSNFTRSLLKAYDIESYYTVIYGGDKKDINEDIVAVQGNHAILMIPNDTENIFLECTSQVNPYNFMGFFTSNRNALVIKPSGGEIIATTNYTPEKNHQKTTAIINLFIDGKATGKVSIDSKFTQYQNVFSLEEKSKEDQEKYYQNYFNYLNQVKVKNVKYVNDKNSFNFNQQFDIEVDNYIQKSGDNIILPVNMLNRVTTSFAKHRNRKFDFEISYGYTDEDDVTFEIPTGYLVKNLPEKTIISNEFGYYCVELIQQQSKIIYKRIIKINEGVFKKELYDTFRNFRDEISRLENLKITIEKK